MNAIGAVLTGLLLVLTQLTTLLQQHVTAVHRGLARPLTQVVGGAATLRDRLARLPKGGTLGDESPAFVHVPTRGRTISIPSECQFEKGRYDLVLHFHGANTTVEPIFERSQINAVFAVLNWGIGSGAYEDKFGDPGSFERMLNVVQSEVSKHCQTDVAVGRIALSAWSAGYGAIGKILAREADARRIDAVLLADGLHVGYEPNARTELNSLQMEPFTLFSYEAAAGEKLMAITHSAIIPPGYASTYTA
jgi:hypothetical protein